MIAWTLELEKSSVGCVLSLASFFPLPAFGVNLSSSASKKKKKKKSALQSGKLLALIVAEGKG
jgi:hypothetical protein